MEVSQKCPGSDSHLKGDCHLTAIAEFLAEVLATGTTADFIHALNTAARAKGMMEVAKQVGITKRITHYRRKSYEHFGQNLSWRSHSRLWID
jgi:DNA-binding phage protein